MILTSKGDEALFRAFRPLRVIARKKGQILGMVTWLDTETKQYRYLDRVPVTNAALEKAWGATSVPFHRTLECAPHDYVEKSGVYDELTLEA